MTIGKKLLLTFGGITALLVVSSAVGLDSVSTLGGALRHSGEVVGRKALLSGELQSYSAKMRAAVRGIILYSMMDKPEIVQRCAGEFRKYSGEVDRIGAEFASLDSNDVERRSAGDVRAAARDWQPVVEEISAVCARKEFGQTLTDTTLRSLANADKLEKAATTLAQVQGESFHASALAAQSRVAATTIWVVAFVAFALGGCIAGLLIVRSSTRTLSSIASMLDLGANQVVAVAHQVSAASTSLAQTATEQAAVVQETAAASCQISAISERNTAHAEKTAGLLAVSAGRVRTANTDLDRMARSMEQITQSSVSISRIIKTIDEIAFQTNILALNAAVESARAGAAGLGFAVVAEEVRNLAHRSAGAAKETETLIQDAAGRTIAGASTLVALQATIHSITADTGKTGTLIDEVLGGSREQVKGIQQISAAMAQLERTAQICASGAEESSAASEELNAQAEEFAEQVSRMRQLVG
jgi:hypothetical protein